MKIAFLATGDELTSGDVLNTNGQHMAQQLFDAGFALGSQATVPDVENAIAEAIRFLLESHEIIIITGGLGPTSDDRTRFALAQALNKSLYFDHDSWQHISSRLQKYNLNIHESNKQQALFPEGCEILENPHGTANGCILKLENKQQIIFMLPGPPNECLPMFQEKVLPFLLQHQSTPAYQNLKWRLFAVSEGEIAAQLDKILEDFPCTTGYRWDYPYLEFKIRIAQNFDTAFLISKIENVIQPHIICSSTQTASELLIQYLSTSSKTITIIDNATHGFLQYTLTDPEIISKLNFASDKNQNVDFHFEVNGLKELWQQHTTMGKTHIELRCQHQNQSFTRQRELIFRSRSVIKAASEYVSFEIQKVLQSFSKHTTPAA